MRVRSTPFQLNALRTSARISTAVITLAVLAACATDKPGPTDLNARVAAAQSGVPFGVGLASPAWQDTARHFVSVTAGFNPIVAGHAYPVLGVAQYLAVQRAEAAIGNGNGGRARLETDRGAVAGASAVVLTYLFPTHAQDFEDLVTTQANAGPGQPHPAFIAAEAIGRSVGNEIVTRTRSDGFSNPNIIVVPTGPGKWVSSTTPPSKPAGGQLQGVTPWFLTSVDQFRSVPPPVYLSPEFNAALVEIRTMADTGNAEMRRIAGFWAFNAGTPTAAGYWLDIASQQIVQHGLSERDATHVFALTSATMFDAVIGCWDAKLTYWLIRPWNADPGIVPLPSMGAPPPNHPSYPSGHSCVSSSGAAVLSAFFPDEQAQLDAMVIDAGLSRMYGGIHYRFDIEAGRTLGRSVAAFTIAQDASGNSVLTAH
jgi:membrane-associated phospholipid phosphatase